ncbi:hypothetical protein MTO96_009751 [Rhipicephalus appendiculatus]
MLKMPAGAYAPSLDAKGGGRLLCGADGAQGSRRSVFLPNFLVAASAASPFLFPMAPTGAGLANGHHGNASCWASETEQRRYSSDADGPPLRCDPPVLFFLHGVLTRAPSPDPPLSPFNGPCRRAGLFQLLFQ